MRVFAMAGNSLVHLELRGIEVLRTSYFLRYFGGTARSYLHIFIGIDFESLPDSLQSVSFCIDIESNTRSTIQVFELLPFPPFPRSPHLRTASYNLTITSLAPRTCHNPLPTVLAKLDDRLTSSLTSRGVVDMLRVIVKHPVPLPTPCPIDKITKSIQSGKPIGVEELLPKLHQAMKGCDLGLFLELRINGVLILYEGRM